jgi:hypothetical protein
MPRIHVAKHEENSWMFHDISDLPILVSNLFWKMDLDHLSNDDIVESVSPSDKDATSKTI